MTDPYEHFLADVKNLIAPLNELHQQAAQACAPAVEHLIHSRSHDAQQIEQTLDRLLDCACIPEGLALFRALCRHYYTINPTATAEYVHAYRQMWDNDEQEAAS